MRRYKVECEIAVTEDDVWQYLDANGEDSDELQEQGYELTDADWEATAEWLFNEDDFTYYDFIEKR